MADWWPCLFSRYWLTITALIFVGSSSYSVQGMDGTDESAYTLYDTNDEQPTISTLNEAGESPSFSPETSATCRVGPFCDTGDENLIHITATDEPPPPYHSEMPPTRFANLLHDTNDEQPVFLAMTETGDPPPYSLEIPQIGIANPIFDVYTMQTSARINNESPPPYTTSNASTINDHHSSPETLASRSLLFHLLENINIRPLSETQTTESRTLSTITTNASPLPSPATPENASSLTQDTCCSNKKSRYQRCALLCLVIIVVTGCVIIGACYASKLKKTTSNVKFSTTLQTARMEIQTMEGWIIWKNRPAWLGFSECQKKFCDQVTFAYADSDFSKNYLSCAFTRESDGSKFYFSIKRTSITSQSSSELFYLYNAMRTKKTKKLSSPVFGDMFFSAVKVGCCLFWTDPVPTQSNTETTLEIMTQRLWGRNLSTTKRTPTISHRPWWL